MCIRDRSKPLGTDRRPVLPVDGGVFLKQLNGVSGSRFGGRGIEPIIRGQSQTQVNVLLDGAYLHGGCPNRMDPPTSYAALETYEKVTVEKGVQTLQHGSGGSGGTVSYTHLDVYKRQIKRRVSGSNGNLSRTRPNQRANTNMPPPASSHSIAKNLSLIHI